MTGLGRGGAEVGNRKGNLKQVKHLALGWLPVVVLVMYKCKQFPSMMADLCCASIGHIRLLAAY